MLGLFKVSAVAALAMLGLVILFPWDPIPAQVQVIWALALIGLVVSSVTLIWRTRSITFWRSAPGSGRSARRTRRPTPRP